MHLSKELQKQLNLVGSSLELAKTIDKESPTNYAFFLPTTSRNFRVAFGAHTYEYALVLFDRTADMDYELCYLRGSFNSLSRLASSIKAWVETEEEIDTLAHQFEEFERFPVDTFKNPNPKIEARWQYVKNRIFNDLQFWKRYDWEKRYFNLIKEAKQYEAWKNYFPFTSLDWLRFSLNDELTNSWELGLHIVPSWNTGEGTYHVGVPESESKQGYYFHELDAAIAFFDKKLNEYHPIS